MHIPRNIHLPATPPPPPLPVKAAAVPQSDVGVELGAGPVANLELARLKAQYEVQLAALAESKEAELAELAQLRKGQTAQLDQIALERRIAAEFSKKLSVSQKELNESLRAAETFKSERDAALSRLTELSATSAKPATDASSPQHAEWEVRAASRFEEDIAAYRQRIQALLTERDTLTARLAGH